MKRGAKYFWNDCFYMYMIMRTSREVKLLEVKCAACRLLKKKGPKICKYAIGLLPKIRQCAFGLLPKIRQCANGLLPKIRKCAIICCFMRTFANFLGDFMRNWCVAYGSCRRFFAGSQLANLWIASHSDVGTHKTQDKDIVQNVRQNTKPSPKSRS